eukprot:scaffold139443_cov29-Tisochrysis_lutea.AAC.2
MSLEEAARTRAARFSSLELAIPSARWDSNIASDCCIESERRRPRSEAKDAESGSPPEGACTASLLGVETRLGWPFTPDWCPTLHFAAPSKGWDRRAVAAGSLLLSYLLSGVLLVAIVSEDQGLQQLPHDHVAARPGAECPHDTRLLSPNVCSAPCCQARIEGLRLLCRCSGRTTGPLRWISASRAETGTASWSLSRSYASINAPPLQGRVGNHRGAPLCFLLPLAR